jgi:phosphomannomutase/phosphoglucomutase
LNANIFRALDIRGLVERDLPLPVVRSLGRSIGTFVRRKGQKPVIAVGRDARLSSPSLRDALVEGLVASGVSVVDIGLCATPMLYYAAHTLDICGGVMVTGSHNPPGDNGFKITLDRQSLHGDDIQQLRRTIASSDYETGEGTVSFHEIHRPYADFIIENIRRGPRALKVVVDAGNGPTGPVAPGLLRRLGVDVVELYCDLDGNFPHHHADPTVPENLVDLQAAVTAHGADLGIAYDGDGDRIGVVDADGRILWGDQLMVILARALLQEVPGAAIVAEVKCSQTLFDDIARHGGRPVMSQVGHSLIKGRMKLEHAELAGEMSGHIFYKHRYFGFDDAMYTTCRLIEILQHTEEPVSALLAGLPPTFATPELRLDCPDDLKFGVVAAVTAAFRATHEVIDIDGVRVRFPDGWGLVRASNTGPVLVMRCEAETPEGRDRIQAELTRAVANAKKIASVGEVPA